MEGIRFTIHRCRWLPFSAFVEFDNIWKWKWKLSYWETVVFESLLSLLLDNWRKKCTDTSQMVKEIAVFVLFWFIFGDAWKEVEFERIEYLVSGAHRIKCWWKCWINISNWYNRQTIPNNVASALGSKS